MKTYTIELDDHTAAALDAWCAANAQTPAQAITGTLQRLIDITTTVNTNPRINKATRALRDALDHELGRDQR